jgi:hypothetical protein
MKTNDSFAVYEKKEKIVRLFATFSMVSLSACLFSIVLFLFWESTIFSKIAVLNFTLFFLPFLLLQFFMSAGIYGKGLGWTYLLFYIFFFPFVDMCFFTGIDIFFNILPIPRLLDLNLANMTIEEYHWIARGYIFGIYIIFNGAGLLWRIGKHFTRKSVPVLLSL